MIYLPAGANEYDNRYGIKKYQFELEPSDIGF